MMPTEDTAFRGGLDITCYLPSIALTNSPSFVPKSVVTGVNACSTLDVPFYENSLRNWGNRVGDFISAVSAQNPVSGTVQADFNQCRIFGTILLENEDTREFDEQYTDCSKEGWESDQSLRAERYFSLQAVGTVDPGAIGMSFDSANYRDSKLNTDYWIKFYKTSKSSTYLVRPADEYNIQTFKVSIDH
jgi:hypothetical protein